MKQNQKGAVDFILILVFIAVVIVGVLIYLRVIDKEETAKITNFDECVAAGNPVAESYPEQCTSEDGQTFTRDIGQDDNVNNPAFDDVVTEVGRIKLIKPSDVSKLPPQTPATFVIYMKSILENNPQPKPGCNNVYTVEKVSALNVSGANGWEGEVTACDGGAAVYWYYQDGEWQDLGLQNIAPCNELEKTNIYSEFIENCIDETTNEIIPNPNGSIVEATLAN